MKACILNDETLVFCQISAEPSCGVVLGCVYMNPLPTRISELEIGDISRNRRGLQFRPENFASKGYAKGCRRGR